MPNVDAVYVTVKLAAALFGGAFLGAAKSFYWPPDPIMIITYTLLGAALVGYAILPSLWYVVHHFATSIRTT